MKRFCSLPPLLLTLLLVSLFAGCESAKANYLSKAESAIALNAREVANVPPHIIPDQSSIIPDQSSLAIEPAASLSDFSAPQTTIAQLDDKHLQQTTWVSVDSFPKNSALPDPSALPVSSQAYYVSQNGNCSGGSCSRPAYNSSNYRRGFPIVRRFRR